MPVQVILLPAIDVDRYIVEQDPHEVGIPQSTYAWLRYTDSVRQFKIHQGAQHTHTAALFSVWMEKDRERDVTYETKWHDLVPAFSVARDVAQIVSSLEAMKIPRLFLPESGLASVPMKNAHRVRNSIQAHYNLNIIKGLEQHRRLDSVYMRLSLGSAYLKLTQYSELSL